LTGAVQPRMPLGGPYWSADQIALFQTRMTETTRINANPTTPPMMSTVDLNTAFHKLVAGTIWENYELIATQWPDGRTGLP
jgi:hypothetical protein